MAVPFIIAHWELFAALAVVLGLLVLSYQLESLQGYAGVDPAQAVVLINSGAYVLDLRPATDYAGGRLAQAERLDPAGIDAWARAPKRKRDRAVLLVTGPRQFAGRTAYALRKAGFTRVHLLRGGLKGWVQAQLPVQR